MRIAITAGGTGGHVYPAQAVLDELKRRELESGKIEINLLFLSGGTDIDLKHTNVKAKRIMSGKYRRDAPWTLPANIFKTCAGIIQSFWHLFFFMPDVVLSTGGYGALPVSIASIIFFIPLVIHEQNAVPGVANAITGKFARKICLTFDKAQEFFSKKKTVKTGLPIRKALLGKKRAEAIEYYKLDGTVPVLFISGGSQGSQPINATVIEILDKLIAHCHVIHQVGEENLPLMKLETNEVLRESPYKNRYHIYGLLKDEEMGYAYAAADLILCRAGASSITEISSYGKPSILIPFPYAAVDHQRQNAYAYANEGAALVVEQQNLQPNFLLERITTLLQNPAELKKMAASTTAFAHPDAEQAISNILMSL